MKNNLGLCGAESVEVQGVRLKGSKRELVLDIAEERFAKKEKEGVCGAKSVEVHKVMGGKLVLNIAHCKLVGSKKVGLGAGSTTIPCEVHTIPGGLHFCGQSIQDQVRAKSPSPPHGHC